MSHLFVTNMGNKARDSVLNQAGNTAEQMTNLALLALGAAVVARRRLPV